MMTKSSTTNIKFTSPFPESQAVNELKQRINANIKSNTHGGCIGYRDGIWKTEYPKMLELIKKNIHFYQGILEKKSEYKLLLESIEESGVGIYRYANFLVGKSKKKTIQLYVDKVREDMAAATDRRGYREVCRNITDMYYLGAEKEAGELRSEFFTKYPKRTAMQDELWKMRIPKERNKKI